MPENFILIIAATRNSGQNCLANRTLSSRTRTVKLLLNAVAGTPVCAVAVSMSDGSAFSGNLAASPAGTVAISSDKLVLARSLSPADDGSYMWGVTATQNAVELSAAIAVKVSAAGPPSPPSGDHLTTDDGSAILTNDDGSASLIVS